MSAACGQFSALTNGGDFRGTYCCTCGEHESAHATFAQKLETFRALVESDTREEYRAQWERDQQRGHNYPLSVHEPQMVAKVKIGKKYANVDVGSSGRYMVVMETGEIFGIKAYGVIHRGHQYGTLDTIKEWNWGPYKAFRKPATIAA